MLEMEDRVPELMNGPIVQDLLKLLDEDDHEEIREILDSKELVGVVHLYVKGL